MTTKVLIIDDDPAFRALARRLLDGSGFQVVGEAATAAEGSHAAGLLRPDAILLDVGLPDRDGVEVAADLAALPWSPRVLLASVDPDVTSDQTARGQGACGFIGKHDLPGAGIDLLAGDG